jgi:hypothetical protein
MAVIERPNGIAPVPSGTYRFGAKGGRMAQAWQYVWNRLDHTTFKNGQELADLAAKEFGVKRASVAEMLSRMRSTGVLEQELIPVPTTYSRGKGYTANRPRVHYRIAQQTISLEAGLYDVSRNFSEKAS